MAAVTPVTDMATATAAQAAVAAKAERATVAETREDAAIRTAEAAAPPAGAVRELDTTTMAAKAMASPARQAAAQIASALMPGTSTVHRQLWKYQYWLNGFNGGPIRQPQPRNNDNQMRALRQGLLRSGITPAPGEDADFFVGRNPED